MTCTICNSKLHKHQKINGKQQYKCSSCGKYSTPQPTYTAPKDKPKVLLFDLETSHIEGKTFGVWNQNIRQQHIIKDWYLLCWAGKWLWEDTTFSYTCTPEESLKRDDERIFAQLKTAFDDADVIMAYNGVKFDIPRANQKFAKYKMGKPTPYLKIDPIITARHHFKFLHNSMDYVAEQFGLDRKIHTSEQLWFDCENGDQKALDKMTKYCEGDINVMEDVYHKLAPYMTNHPNFSLYIKDDGVQRCPICLSENLIPEKKFYTTRLSKFPTIKCNKCGSFHRESKKGILTPLAR